MKDSATNKKKVVVIMLVMVLCSILVSAASQFVLKVSSDEPISEEQAKELNLKNNQKISIKVEKKSSLTLI